MAFLTHTVKWENEHFTIRNRVHEDFIRISAKYITTDMWTEFIAGLFVTREEYPTHTAYMYILQPPIENRGVII